MRSEHKRWQDKRPGWTRRVRWLEGPQDIRLEFSTPEGVHNDIYRGPDRQAAAQTAYDAFRNAEAGN